MKLALAALGDLDRHATPEWHPECAPRLVAATAGVADLHLDSDLVVVAPRQATVDELARVHPTGYVEALARLSAAGGGEVDPDTVVSEGTYDTACYAAGAGLAVLDQLASGEADLGFVVARPPGHHATRAQAMGFCIFNNVAVAAASLTAAGERVVIVDWDVHHGNGTQDIFWNDPNVLYVSTHQSPLYPGTGRVSESGGPMAPGTTVNFPFPEATTGDHLLRALDEVVAPIVESFAPGWVLVSAGFDAHRCDPLGGLVLSTGDFAALACRVASFAPQPRRMALFLEGGYDPDALRTSVAATVGALMGIDAAEEAPTSGGPGDVTVEAAKRIRERLAETGGWS